MFNRRTILLLVSSLLLITSVRADWPTYSGNFERTDYANTSFNTSYIRMVWNLTYNQTNITGISPIIYDDTLYTLTVSPADLVAVNPVNGKIRWSTNIINAQCDGLTAVNNIVYVGCSNNRTYAIDLLTRSILWNASVNRDFEDRSAPAYSNGRVFFGTAAPLTTSGYLYALNATSGAMVWNYSTQIVGNSYRQPPAVKNGIVYAVNDGGFLVALNESDGGMIWNYSTGTERSFPTIGDGIIYMINSGGSTYIRAFNASTGEVIWSDNNDWWGNDDKSPLLVGNRLIEPNYYLDVIRAFNASTGSVLWSVFPSPGIGYTQMVEAVANDQYLFQGTKYNSNIASKIYVLDVTNGNTVATFDLSNRSITLGPVLYNHMLYYSDSLVDGNSYNVRLNAIGVPPIYPNVTLSANPTAVVGVPSTITLTATEGTYSLNSVWFTVNGTLANISSAVGGSNQLIWIPQASGNISIIGYVNDTYDDSVSTISFDVSVSPPTYPIISLTLNQSTIYQGRTIVVSNSIANGSLSLDKTWFTVNGTLANISSAISSVNTFVWDSDNLSGNYSFISYVNDTLGNVNSTAEEILFVEIPNMPLVLSWSVNESNATQGSILNVTLALQNGTFILDKWWFEYNGTPTNTTPAVNGSNVFLWDTSGLEGNYSLTAYANDTESDLAISSSFWVNINPQILTITIIVNETNPTAPSILLVSGGINIRSIYQLDKWWFVYNGTLGNITNAQNGANNTLIWITSGLLGNYSVLGYVNNTAGNQSASSEVWVNLNAVTTTTIAGGGGGGGGGSSPTTTTSSTSTTSTTLAGGGAIPPLGIIGSFDFSSISPQTQRVLIVGGVLALFGLLMFIMLAARR